MIEYDFQRGFPGGISSKDSAANARDARDMSLIPGLGRSLGVGNGNPLQYSCLENSMDRGTWWATVHVATKSQTQLSTTWVPEEGYEVVRKGHVLGIWRFLIWDIRDEQLPTINRSKRHAEKILHDFSMEEREKKPICENIHSSGTQSSVLIQEAQQLSRLINFFKIHI